MKIYNSLLQSLSITTKILVVIASSMLFTAHTHAVTLDQAASDFKLINTEGKKVKLSDYLGKTVVLEWTNHLCPFVKKHYESGNMQNTQKHALDQGVVWLSIISSAPGKQGHVSAEKAKQISAKHKGLATTILLDESGTVGKLYGAKTTPHMYIIDSKGMLRYKGAIDSIPSASKKDIAKATNYVTKALDELANNKAISNTATKPYGCSVKYSS